MIFIIAKEFSGTQSNINGLSQREVIESRAKHGKNILPRAKRKSFARQFLSNLGDPVIKILIGALILNLILTFRHANWVESIGIAISVLLATFISTASEYGSQSAFENLEERSRGVLCRALRDGETVQIPIDEIVVGDIVLLESGEQIPADGEIISGKISCDQSAMTGEGVEVYKRPIKDTDTQDLSPASPYFCLRGCLVLSGSAKIRVTHVGEATFLGGISREIQTDTRESPLKIRLSKLAKQISAIGYFAAILVALVYLFNTFFVDSAFDPEIIKYKITALPFLAEHLLHALTLALTVVVVAVPEGLPMMIAVVLSANVKKMVKDQVLVRKPVGIEAAGSMNILFTDKTGTLTEGNLSVGKIYLGDGKEYSIAELSSLPAFNDYLLSAYGNTTCSVGTHSGKKQAIGGNSTDRAILNSVISLSHTTPKFSVISLTPFDSDRKYSSATLLHASKKRTLIKGAPEIILPKLAFFRTADGGRAPASQRKLDSLFSSLSEKGKRVLAIAEQDGGTNTKAYEESGSLTLICLITLEDRLRREAARSVEILRGAGIQVVMITGDSKNTARSIAETCGILKGEVDLVLSGGELQTMSDDKLKAILPRLGVVARALPSDKSRLVRISQELNLVVGMTGDGVNDAPALKRADVGFAMGSGTQVAKDAGDVIILDNDLASITTAVLYGRNIFKSIRKFISLQLMMNLCAVGVSMICPFLGYDAPVTVVQMLWINIIMDTLGGLAFAGEAPLPSCMKETPKRRDEPILNPYMIYEIIFGGGFTVALCIAFLKMPELSSRFRPSPDRIYLLTAFFALFIFASVFNCFCARTDRLSLTAGITKNKAFIGIMASILFIQILFIYLGGRVLRTAPLLPRELSFTLAIAILVFPADLLRKVIWRIFGGKHGY